MREVLLEVWGLKQDEREGTEDGRSELVGAPDQADAATDRRVVASIWSAGGDEVALGLCKQAGRQRLLPWMGVLGGVHSHGASIGGERAGGWVGDTPGCRLERR